MMRPGGAPRHLVRLLLPLLLLGGCSGEQPTENRMDGGIEAAPQDAGQDATVGCSPEFGRTYLLDTILFMDQGEGRDLNGDGQPDNSIWFLGISGNYGWKESILRGDTIWLFEMANWSDPPTPDDPDIQVSFHQAWDADVPADPTNNFDGEGCFLAQAADYDLDCRPMSRFEHATLADRRLEISSTRFAFISPYGGTIPLVNVTAEIVFQEDYFRFSWTMGGVVTACGLARAPYPGSTTGSLLDAVVNWFSAAPDMDLDQDGSEQIVGDGVGIKECIDADGTIIPGADCPCDPRIADGYSTALEGTGVLARIVGVSETRP